MIAHFVGGPWHGEDRAFDSFASAYPYIKGVKFPPISWSADVNPAKLVEFEEFEYRRIGPVGATVAGLTLYEYVEPTVEVEIVVRKRVPQSKAEQTRTELVRELQLPEGGRLYYSGLARD
jgi:hypothetical protein